MNAPQSPNQPPAPGMPGYVYVVPEGVSVIPTSPTPLELAYAQVPTFRRRASQGILLGLLLSMLGSGIAVSGSELGIGISLLGTVLFMYGGWNYARGRGYHGAWGFLSFFGLIGLLVLACFPNRYKHLEPPRDRRRQMIVRYVLLAMIGVLLMCGIIATIGSALT